MTIICPHSACSVFGVAGTYKCFVVDGLRVGRKSKLQEYIPVI